MPGAWNKSFQFDGEIMVCNAELLLRIVISSRGVSDAIGHCQMLYQDVSSEAN